MNLIAQAAHRFPFTWIDNEGISGSIAFAVDATAKFISIVPVKSSPDFIGTIISPVKESGQIVFKVNPMKISLF